MINGIDYAVLKYYRGAIIAVGSIHEVCNHDQPNGWRKLGKVSTMFRLMIETDNAAFGDHAVETAAEVARILRKVADRLASGENYGRVFDINGNAVGRFGLESADDV